MRRISELYHAHNGTPGYRMMYYLLKLEKVEISKTTVHKYMQEMHLHSIARRNAKYNAPKGENVVFPNIISRDFNPSARNKVWCTDFTNLEYAGGTVRYNCSIIDLFDRSVVASLNSSLLNSELAINTLRKALLTHKVSKGLILHSDYTEENTMPKFLLNARR